jgi:hypothetical protein
LEDGSGRGRAAEPRLARPDREARPQLSLFEAPGSRPAVPPAVDAGEAEVLAALRAADLDGFSPRAAWELLAELRKKLTPTR